METSYLVMRILRITHVFGNIFRSSSVGFAVSDLPHAIEVNGSFARFLETGSERLNSRPDDFGPLESAASPLLYPLFC